MHSSCDSLALLEGRGSVGPAGGSEPHSPNTLDGCADGNSGTYHGDESNDRIVVRMLDPESPLEELQMAVIEAHVWACNCRGDMDSADFYYSASAVNPAWVYVGSAMAPEGGRQVLEQQYKIPAGSDSGSVQAVRVNFRYGDSGALDCSSLEYSDTDDLAFAVLPAPPSPCVAENDPCTSSDECCFEGGTCIGAGFCASALTEEV